MIKLIILLFTLLSVNLSNAAEITTGNLLPNAGQGASSAQSIDSSVPKIGSSFIVGDYRFENSKVLHQAMLQIFLMK